MDADFWLDRWREGRTHFHQTRVTPLLQKYWPTLDVPAGGQVLVPLAGKSLDMVWLAGQGLRVLGVELSQLAVEQFFDENDLRPEIHQSAQGRHYVAGNLELICGDVFALEDATLAACAGVYDRAALVALPEPMRSATRARSMAAWAGAAGASSSRWTIRRTRWKVRPFPWTTPKCRRCMPAIPKPA